MTKTNGVIVAAVAHEQNLYDGHTLLEVLELVEAVTDARPSHAIVDRGYRGHKHVGDTEILVPGRPPAAQSKAMNAKMQKRFRRPSSHRACDRASQSRLPARPLLPQGL